MRVLHINATSHTGGAARAMRRLHTALVRKGHQSQFLVGRTKFPEDPLVHKIWDVVSEYRTLEDRLLSRIGNQLEKLSGLHPWSNRTNLKLVNTSLYHWADIIDLRNLFGSFFNIWSLPALSEQKPVVWRLPDLWALTGHCAYPYDCSRWITGCFDCPLFTKEGRKIVEPRATLLDGTRRVWRAKRGLYGKSKLHVIVTTEWMKEQVSQSILGNAKSINVISNGVDLEIYRPRSKSEARAALNLPQDEIILLWGAGSKGNYRKGYHLAEDALEYLQGRMDPAPLLLTMGGDKGWEKPEKLRKVVHLGYVRDPEKQAMVYGAADVFLCTTLADAQPQTALESLACGIPLIAFDVGPMPDLAIEGKTGFIAREKTFLSLGQEISNFLNLSDHWLKMRENCRKEALTRFDLEKQTNKYLDLYEGILGNYPA